MGVYSKLGKIEKYINKYIDVNMVYLHGEIRVHHLKDEWKEIMYSFGFNDDNIIFAVSQFKESLKCISPGFNKDNKPYNDYIDWLHYNVKGGYYYWEDDGHLEEHIDECYVKLQKFFIFLEIYTKQRNTMERLIKLEWDTIDDKLETGT